MQKVTAVRVMQPEYKDAVTVIGTSRFVGPISQGQRIDFSWTKFSILRPVQPSRRRNGCWQLWKIFKRCTLRPSSYISFQKLRTLLDREILHFSMQILRRLRPGIIVSLLHRITSNMINVIFVRKLFIFELELFLSIFFSSYFAPTLDISAGNKNRIKGHYSSWL